MQCITCQLFESLRDNLCSCKFKLCPLMVCPCQEIQPTCSLAQIPRKVSYMYCIWCVHRCTEIPNSPAKLAIYCHILCFGYYMYVHVVFSGLSSQFCHRFLLSLHLRSALDSERYLWEMATISFRNPCT